MSINSFSMLIAIAFLMILLGVLQLIRLHNGRLDDGISIVQRVILLLFSYWFIWQSNVRFLIVIMIYTVIVYFLGRCLETGKTIRGVMTVDIVVSVMMLGYFKYTNFFLSGLSLWMREFSALENIILPIGISFYTFSGMAYLIDIYRGEYLLEKSILNVALYIAFFAKLTAGPIVRGRVFLPQLKQYKGLAVKD